MKRVLALILAALFLMPSALAVPPTDVSKMSDAALKELYLTVKEELMARKLWDESILPSGLYQAGKGLPEGTYECTARKKGLVIIYKDWQHFSDDKSITWWTVEEGEMFVLSLYGEIVYRLPFDSVVKPFTGLSW